MEIVFPHPKNSQYPVELTQLRNKPATLRDRDCLVVFSGGQDSTTCLHWAIKSFKTVRAIFFQYGQRHACEQQAAETIASIVRIKLKTFNLNFFKEMGGNALTDDKISIFTHSGSLPSTFVPGRNLIFLTCAASYALQYGIQDLVTGVCQTDYSGYPDCREKTIQSLEETLSYGMDAEFRIHTPLMHLSKAESVKLAGELGAMNSLAFSHTCYRGESPPCGSCPACLLREKGFREAGISDPLLKRLADGTRE